jgi:WD40 repeat protein
MHWSGYLTDRLSLCLAICLSVCLSVCLSICLSVYLSACGRSGRWLVWQGGFDDGSVRVWDHTNRGNGAKQAESNVLRGHAGAVYGCEFCRDSRFVISTGHDGTARLWSLQVCTCMQAHPRGRGEARRGDELAAIGRSRQPRQIGSDTDWMLCRRHRRHCCCCCCEQRGTALSVYQGHEQAVWTVAAASTGPYFVTGSLDHTARLWTIDRCLCKTVWYISLDGKILHFAKTSSWY